MSRIGKLPVIIPEDVKVTINGSKIDVSGAKGSLSLSLVPGIQAQPDQNKIILTRADDQKINKSNHGLMRSLLNNMVYGVKNEFEKKLEINGVGFKVNLNGDKLVLNVGFSHPVEYKIPEGIKITVEQNIISISGIDKQKVGQVAAEIRDIKKPEPYKGKGIKYIDEKIIRKSGKSGKDK